MRGFVFILFVVLLLSSFHNYGYAYSGGNYTTPDSWSKHYNANGVKYSMNGLDLGDKGTLKLGLTTRLDLKISEITDIGVYQYFRGSLTDFELGSGTMKINLNLRGGWVNNPRPAGTDQWAFFDATRLGMDPYDVDLRIYQANVILEDVIPITDIALGRIYLSEFEGYKIDGIDIGVHPSEYFNMNLFYGLPVSYYSSLITTQVVGTTVDVPISQSGTRIRGNFSYFFQYDDVLPETYVGKIRVDQTIPWTTIYAEGTIINNANIFDAGFDLLVDISRSELSGYIMGQVGRNADNSVNPYVSLYEDMFGASSEYIMGGFLFTQGIIDTVMVGLGFEARYNIQENYASRDYYRVFANVDLVDLLWKNNFVSIIFDWYDIPAYGRHEANQELLVGFRMTQVINDRLELWTGFNVMNYQYKNSPIKYYSQDAGVSAGSLNAYGEIEQFDNTAIAYIGGMYKITDWCLIQLDYMFDYADILKQYDTRPDAHMVELWVNFLW